MPLPPTAAAAWRQLLPFFLPPPAQPELPACPPCDLLAHAPGVEFPDDDGTSGGGAEEAGEGQEGIEGVDWRYGSVAELDPSEWQVGRRHFCWHAC